MKKQRTSFTLVEMIVAMGVLSILTFLLFSVLNETSRVTSATMGKNRAVADLRIVIDQMLRELQQAVDDNQRQCFFASSNASYTRLHFLATIDNNTGNEDVEVHYTFTSSVSTNRYQLMKDLEYWTVGGLLNSQWDSTNSTDTWYNTPLLNDSRYIAVLDGVKSVGFRFSSDNVTWPTTWDYKAAGSNLPTYVEVTIQYCDPQDVTRYKGTVNVPGNLVRTNQSVVYLPRNQ